MSPIIPPWEDINPSQFIDAAAKGASLGLQYADLTERGREANQSTALSQAKLSVDAGLESDRTAAESQANLSRTMVDMANLDMARKQSQAKQQMEMMQMQLSKQESDRQFQLQSQQKAMDASLQQQQMDLASKNAAQKFQAQQGYQSFYNQLVDQGSDPAEASALAFARFGPMMGESMAGAGTMLKASMTPQINPPSMVTDPDSGQSAWSYNGKMYPVKQPAEQDFSKGDAAYVSSLEKQRDKLLAQPEYDTSKELQKQVKDLNTKIAKVTGHDEEEGDSVGGSDIESLDSATGKSPATDRYQIISVE